MGPMRPVRRALPSFSGPALNDRSFVKLAVICFAESDDFCLVESNESCVIEPDDGGGCVRVLDFFTFFSYIGSDGE